MSKGETSRKIHLFLVRLLPAVVDIAVVNGLLAVTMHISDCQPVLLPVILANLSLCLLMFSSLWSGLSDDGLNSGGREIIFSEGLRFVGFFSLLFASSLFLSRSAFPVDAYLCFVTLIFLVVPFARVITHSVVRSFRKKKFGAVRCLVIGTGEPAMRLTDNILADRREAYVIEGYIDIVKPEGFSGNFLGTIDELETILDRIRVDEIYFTLPGENVSLMRRILKEAEDRVARIYIIPRISRNINRTFRLKSVGSCPVLAIHQSPLAKPFNLGVKRCFDILFSSVVLLGSPILFIPFAIAVKLSSPGPVFFKQRRTGYKGHIFTCYKFRSMVVNDDADTRQASDADPRATKVGQFLRVTGLDELPQFFNVLRGDMSVVGPRPHMLSETKNYADIIEQYMVRHYVKPGITGLAQVTGYRGHTPWLWQMEGRVQRDVWYIENWTFMLDIKIIVKTVWNMLS